MRQLLAIRNSTWHGIKISLSLMCVLSDRRAFSSCNDRPKIRCVREKHWARTQEGSTIPTDLAGVSGIEIWTVIYREKEKLVQRPNELAERDTCAYYVRVETRGVTERKKREMRRRRGRSKRRDRRRGWRLKRSYVGKKVLAARVE